MALGGRSRQRQACDAFSRRLPRHIPSRCYLLRNRGSKRHHCVFYVPQTYFRYLSYPSDFSSLYDDSVALRYLCHKSTIISSNSPEIVFIMTILPVMIGTLHEHCAYHGERCKQKGQRNHPVRYLWTRYASHKLLVDLTPNPKVLSNQQKEGFTSGIF